MGKTIDKMDNSNGSYMKKSYWVHIPCSYEKPYKWLYLFGETKIYLQFISEIIQKLFAFWKFYLNTPWLYFYLKFTEFQLIS